MWGTTTTTAAAAAAAARATATATTMRPGIRLQTTCTPFHPLSESRARGFWDSTVPGPAMAQASAESIWIFLAGQVENLGEKCGNSKNFHQSGKLKNRHQNEFGEDQELMKSP